MVWIRVCFVVMPTRYEVEVGQIFFRSVSLLPKTKISIYLCVFVIDRRFLNDRRDLGLICFLAGIVTSAFGTQSINFFDNTNSELTC